MRGTNTNGTDSGIKEGSSKISGRPDVWHRLSSMGDFQQLLKSFQKWSATLPIGVGLVAFSGRILAASARFPQLTGKPAAVTWNSLFADEADLAVKALKAVKTVQSGEADLCSFKRKATWPDGTVSIQRWYASALSDNHFLLIVEEISKTETWPGAAEAPLGTDRAKGLRGRPESAGSLEKEAFGATRALLLSVIDALGDPVAVVDDAGDILASNKAWRRFSRESFSSSRESNYLKLLGKAFSRENPQKKRLLAGIGSVLEGTVAEFGSDVAFDWEGRSAWFHICATALPVPQNHLFLISHRDVTDRHRVERDLRESHALFRHVIEGSQDGIFLYDMEDRFVMTNTACAETFGFTVHQTVGRSISEIFTPDLAQTIREQNELVRAGGQTLNFEMLIETPRGARTFLISKSGYRNHHNEIVGIFGVARDITDRKQAEKALAESERHFRALIENSADRVGLVREDGTIRYASPSTKRIVGFESGELIDTDAFLLVHPEDRLDAVRRFRELLELPGASITGEYRTLCKDGNWLWMEATATNLVRDPSVGAVVINERDISGRKQAELELLRYAAIVESSNDGIIAADSDGSITSWNPAAERIFGYAGAEILGRNVGVLVPPDCKKEHDEIRAAALRGKGTNDFETVCIGKGNRRINISLTLSPIRDRDRRIIGFSKIIRDITDRRRLEKEILEVSDREKQRLGQDLHDDLCQHLVGISLISNLLSEELASLGLEQAVEARQVTELVRKAVDHARSLARGLSPLNLVDSGFMAGLETLVLNTQRLFRVPCAFECKAPIFMKNATVGTHLYRITQEALHNAVKHSQATKVTVTLESVDNAIVITVHDNGVGFPQPSHCAPADHLGQTGGFGMHTMHYRARILGATLAFKRNPEGGTSVVCRLPNRRRSSCGGG